MASQRITITKLSGASAVCVLARCREWLETRLSDEQFEWGSAQWPESVRQEIDVLASGLRANGHQPPVVFFSEHVDLWSMGDVFKRWLLPHGGEHCIELHSDRFQLWCYPLPDGGSLASHVQRSTRLKRIRDRSAQEERWFTVTLLEAVHAWNSLGDAAVLVVLREVLGGLVMDSELDDSMKVVPDWINRV